MRRSATCRSWSSRGCGSAGRARSSERPRAEKTAVLLPGPFRRSRGAPHQRGGNPRRAGPRHDRRSATPARNHGDHQSPGGQGGPDAGPFPALRIRQFRAPERRLGKPGRTGHLHRNVPVQSQGNPPDNEKGTVSPHLLQETFPSPGNGIVEAHLPRGDPAGRNAAGRTRRRPERVDLVYRVRADLCRAGRPTAQPGGGSHLLPEGRAIVGASYREDPENQRTRPGRSTARGDPFPVPRGNGNLLPDPPAPSVPRQPRIPHGEIAEAFLQRCRVWRPTLQAFATSLPSRTPSCGGPCSKRISCRTLRR